MTAEEFITAFRKLHGWSCKPGSRIAKDLTEFANKHLDSTASAEELYSIFCLSNGIAPYPQRKRRGVDKPEDPGE
jgi:hypothetical protein